MLAEARSFLVNNEYEKSYALTEQFFSIAKNAEESMAVINSVLDAIKRAEYYGLPVSETKNIINLARAAFEREDFEIAFARAKQAEIVLALESGGRFNVLNFIKRNWPWILLAILGLTIVSFIAYKKLSILFITEKSLIGRSITPTEFQAVLGKSADCEA